MDTHRTPKSGLGGYHFFALILREMHNKEEIIKYIQRNIKKEIE